jgi:hypothetical protein
VKRARFLAPAREEFLADVAYYDQVRPGQGVRLAAAVEEATDRTRIGFSALGLAGNTNYSPCDPQELPILHRLSARGGWHRGLRGCASFTAARVLEQSSIRALMPA